MIEEKDRLEKTVVARVTKAEYANIRAAASVDNRKVSDWIRLVLREVLDAKLGRAAARPTKRGRG